MTNVKINPHKYYKRHAMHTSVKSLPPNVLNIATQLSTALIDAGIDVAPPTSVNGCKLSKKGKEEALGIPFLPVADYLNALLKQIALKTRNSNPRKKIEALNYITKKPATLDYIIFMKNSDETERFSIYEIVNILKAHEINPDFTEELLEEKNNKGNYKYTAREICHIIKLTKYNPNIKEFAKKDPSELYSGLQHFLMQSKYSTKVTADNNVINIKKRRFSKEEIGALLNAYCIDKNLTYEALKYRNDTGFEIEDFVKKNQTHSDFSINLLKYKSNEKYKGISKDISTHIFKFNLNQITQIANSIDVYGEDYVRDIINDKTTLLFDKARVFLLYLQQTAPEHNSCKADNQKKFEDFLNAYIALKDRKNTVHDVEIIEKLPLYPQLALKILNSSIDNVKKEKYYIYSSENLKKILNVANYYDSEFINSVIDFANSTVKGKNINEYINNIVNYLENAYKYSNADFINKTFNLFYIKTEKTDYKTIIDLIFKSKRKFGKKTFETLK